MQKSVFITGVAGLIGARFAQWMLDHTDYEVVGLDNMTGGYDENLPGFISGGEEYRFSDSRFVFYKGDCEDVELVGRIFRTHEPEYVFHFAAYAAEGLSPFIRMFNYRNNMLSTANIINNCITYGVKRLVYTSSMSVYGEGIHGVRFDEDLKPAPEDPYAISKYACEMDIQCAGQLHGLDWCIIRPHNVYGVGQNIWDRYRNVLGIWMYQKLVGEPITIYGDGKQTRAFSYIDDCLPCFWNAAIYEKASKQIVNLGGIIPFSIKDACEIELKVIGDHPVVHKETRYEVKHAIPSYQKSIDVLDYRETTSLKEGLAEMWAWAQKQPKRERFKWPFYEVEKGLYSYWK